MQNVRSLRVPDYVPPVGAHQLARIRALGAMLSLTEEQLLVQVQTAVGRGVARLEDLVRHEAVRAVDDLERALQEERHKAKRHQVEVENPARLYSVEAIARMDGRREIHAGEIPPGTVTREDAIRARQERADQPDPAIVDVRPTRVPPAPSPPASTSTPAPEKLKAAIARMEQRRAERAIDLHEFRE